MEELKYLMFICLDKHKTVFPANEAYPEECQVCHQPFDGKTPPIPCRKDGSVLQDDNTDHSATEEASSVPVDTLEAGTAGGVNETETGVPSIVKASEARKLEYISPENRYPKITGSSRGRKNSTGQAVPTIPRGMQELSPAVSQDVQSSPLVQGNTPELALYNGGDCIEIPSEEGILGRESIGQDIFGINPLISREHASIKVGQNGIVLVKDVGSLNGTYVDDGSGRRKLIPHKTVELKKGCRIWLANCILVIEEKR